MDDVKKHIRLLFDRPSEPLFMPKGEGKDEILFDVRDDFVSERYATIGVEISNRLGNDNEKVPFAEVKKPDLSIVQKLRKDEKFSLFFEKHREIATAFIKILMDVPEGELRDFLATAAICRDSVNTQLFNYCLSVAVLHRKDLKGLPLPNFMEKFPTYFCDNRVFQDCREVCRMFSKKNRRMAPSIEIPRNNTATDLELEHKVAYFREDIGINLHHWHWHLVYPNSGGEKIIKKDRRGELFFYMHQQILARYNSERLCNQLGRVKRFNDFRKPIEEGYYSKLSSSVNGRAWAPRQANLKWKDLKDLTIKKIIECKDKIDEAIGIGFAMDPHGKSIPLTIDILGNLLESSDLSINKDLYGDLHSYGHIMAAKMHDPEGLYKEGASVMGDVATAMRDPFFYRWHSMIDSMFQRFKESNAVRPYTTVDLINPNISITNVEVNSEGAPVNTFKTFWMKSDVNLSGGLDFSPKGPTFVKFTHLNHSPFTYKIEVNNSGAAKRGTVRIFLGPKHDERNLPMELSEQRLLMIEMDKFVHEFKKGKNTVLRKSEDSSVTIPFERSFREIPYELYADELKKNPDSILFKFCGCGWPQHVLVPKGTHEGARYELFVMVSNYDSDKVNQNVDNVPCSDASSYCGIKDSLYPDKRDMGFPFDRPSLNDSNSLKSFKTDNMFIKPVTINFSGKTYPNPKNFQNRVIKKVKSAN